ncbi:hypothetical protein THF5H11_170041 [Vibrio jasicida]|nr:hypothetical protein THF5H11_170041 [Vibrio jasicida]
MHFVICATPPLARYILLLERYFVINFHFSFDKLTYFCSKSGEKWNNCNLCVLYLTRTGAFR